MCNLKKIATLMAGLIMSLLLVACSASPEGSAEGEYVIPVAVPLEVAENETDFLDGVEIAISEIEKKKLPISVVIEDDKAEFSEAVNVAEKYLEDPNVIGVVGHWYSSLCQSIVPIYERAEKPLIVPTVSLSSLVDEDSQYVYQNIPSDGDSAKVLVDYAKEMGYDSAIVYYEDSEYGSSMATELEQYAKEQGITVKDKVSNIVNEDDFMIEKRRWDIVGYDSVFILSNLETGLEFIDYFRNSDQDTPILCSDGMVAQQVKEKLSSGEAGVVITSFAEDENSTICKDFKESFIKKYDRDPTMWAYQGYDSVMLIAEAIESGKVKSSEDFKDYLDTTESIQSLYGEISFTENNVVKGKEITLTYTNSSGIEEVNYGK